MDAIHDLLTRVNSRPINVLLTIDLTQDVAAEAIQSNSDIIVAYHPFIFRGLKSITQKDPQQRSLLRLIQHNISVYCPHTAVDSAKDGVNDFLATGLAKGFQVALCVPITPNADFEEAGMGRLLTLERSIPLEKLVSNAKISLGLEHVQVGLARGASRSHPVKTIAICAGSGGLVFSTVKADLFYTGEISHHEALFLTESGSSIIVCGHSNTERGFLKQMRQEILDQVPDLVVVVSECDRDPLCTW